MIRLVFFSLAALAVFVAATCSSGDDTESSDSVLHLRGYDITESDYAAMLRAFFLEASDTDQLCVGLEGLSEEETLATLRAYYDDVPETEELPVGATSIPDQTPTPDDTQRAVRIFMKECERVVARQ